MRARTRTLPVVSALLALVITVLIAGAVLALGGYDPLVALSAFWRGAFGSPGTFISVTLVRATPLLLTGLAVAVAFRAGVWNIGAEGQLYAGAVAAAAVGLAGSGLPAVILLPAVLVASALGGALWASVAALMKVRLGVGEVITTLLLNYIAIDLASWLVHGPMQEARGVFPQTDTLPLAAQLPDLAAGTRLHWGFPLALLLAFLLWLLLRTTRLGFGIRAVGGSPVAAQISGRFSVERIVIVVFLLSGALAGVAGGVEVSGVTGFLSEGLSPGHGYTAIAVALLAGLHPVGVLVTAILFGALGAGAANMQREAGVPAAWASGVEALVILSVLAVDRGLRHLGRQGGAVRGDESAAEAVVSMEAPGV